MLGFKQVNQRILPNDPNLDLGTMYLSTSSATDKHALTETILQSVMKREIMVVSLWKKKKKKKE